MVRPRTSVAAELVLCLGLLGCSAKVGESGSPQPSGSPSGAAHAPTETRASEATSRDATPAPDQILGRGDLAVPANAVVILAPFKGHGNRRLSFDPRRKNVSLVFSCAGEGLFEVSTDSDLADPTPCRRGLPLHLTVASDGSPQLLRVHTTPDTTWRMVAVEGDHLGPRVRPVH